MYLINTILEGTYEATNSITAENNVTVTGTATLKAGNTLSLKPGFHSANGSNFTAKIGTVSTALQRYYYIKDHLGSIRLTTDETGTVVSAQDYFAYGELLREFNSVERYKFTEKERDTETDYDYFGARYYDSELGRWLIADPLTDLSSSISPYAYCFNNPLNYTDPDGMWPWDDPNYIWDPELGRWRLRSIDELWAITGWEKISGFSAEYPVKTFDFDYNQVSNDPWYSSGQFYSYAYSINAYEFYALMEGRSNYGEEDIKAVNEGAVNLAFFLLPTLRLGKLGILIKGFTKHGVNQAITRGFNSQSVIEIIKRGTAITKIGKYGTKNIHITLGGNTLVIETQGRNAGKIISVFSNSPGTRNGLGAGNFIPF